MKRLHSLMILLVVMTLTFSAGYFVGRQPDAVPVSAQTEDRDALFAPFWEVYDLVNSRYIDPLDQQQLMIGAINGMLESIGDENTNYMDPETYARWNESLSGSFEGIGATVEKDEVTGGMRIIRPLDNSPAEASGLLPGDIIMEVGGEDITDLSLSDIISLVRGPAGTLVRLGILREGEPELLEFTIVRARIELPDVEYRMLDNNVGYIRLYQFSDQTTARLRDALTTLNAESLNGLVLDLRNNPGGYLNTSLEVISQFVAEGPILIEQFPGDQEQVFEASGDALAPTVPLAIIVDEGSASASELVAGSLRDLDRAVLVGTQTYGKSTVQTISPISTGGAVRITVARWVTPDGISAEPDGIIPDVEIAFDPESDPEFDNQMAAAVRALKGMNRQQIFAPQG
jgi:carboxyl-terminal processing protease